MIEDARTAIPLAVISEMRKLLFEIINPMVVYDVDKEIMKDNVINNCSIYAEKIITMLNNNT